MTEWNQTDIHTMKFILFNFSGFQDQPSCITLTTILCVGYAVILLENFSFILVLLSDRRLHSPMYMLICNLAILDILIPTVNIPKMMHGLTSHDNMVTFGFCIVQLWFYTLFGTTEMYLLALMAYDRYQAICKPLHYPSVMTNKFVLKLCLLCWMPGICINGIHVYFILNTKYCEKNKVQSYYCNYSAIMSLSCSAVLADMISSVVIIIILSTTLTCIFSSYVKIIMIINTVSFESRQKALSTCASHLSVFSFSLLVSLFVAMSYRLPGFSDDARMISAVAESISVPIANPIIYCIRTKEIREGLLKFLKKYKIIAAEF
ncbi:olfactory receptor 6Y1-like [Protopterus annectens]|uniref:olfactory receptor 6Y1-like n=1 Tax=Protopterus annectens TaxID=7888 RepID=UPI001CFB6D99|nr:olfactory receptor 6Y1-like [Protopterus annectens]